jgi:hypothetical protein
MNVTPLALLSKILWMYFVQNQGTLRINN